MCGLTGSCVAVEDRCSLAVMGDGTETHLLDERQRGKPIRSDLPYVLSQSRLRRDFHVMAPSACLQNAEPAATPQSAPAPLLPPYRCDAIHRLPFSRQRSRCSPSAGITERAFRPCSSRRASGPARCTGCSTARKRWSTPCFATRKRASRRRSPRASIRTPSRGPCSTRSGRASPTSPRASRWRFVFSSCRTTRLTSTAPRASKSCRCSRRSPSPAWICSVAACSGPSPRPT